MTQVWLETYITVGFIHGETCLFSSGFNIARVETSKNANYYITLFQSIFPGLLQPCVCTVCVLWVLTQHACTVLLCCMYTFQQGIMYITFIWISQISLSYIQWAYKHTSYLRIILYYMRIYIYYLYAYIMCTDTEKHSQNWIWMHNIDVHFISVVLSHTV